MTTTVHIERSLFGLTAEGSTVVWTDLPMGPTGAVHVADGTVLFISNAREHDATLTLQVSDRMSEHGGEGFVLAGSWPFSSRLGRMVLDTPNAGGISASVWSRTPPTRCTCGAGAGRVPKSVSTASCVASRRKRVLRTI
ncbi:hypothetical protein WJ438_00625 [Streptomyces sp. GD-15H]|uniref:hypothetical protein n=1 Tax=Streptomyces sp. GD-15H TaxID=3129112 RepID=UPI003248EAB3